MKTVLLISASLQGEVVTRKNQEMMNLCSSLDFQIVSMHHQELKMINKVSYIGSGKVAEIKHYATQNDVEAVVTNFDLTPLQYRTLSDAFGLEVIDRTGIILQIFALRAKTKEAKLQVEIATLKYLKTRLVNQEADYSQVTSGSGHNKGAGEKQIDITRSNYRMILTRKQEELARVKKERETMRKKRQNTGVPIVAIVGYTNAGKSTLLNRLVALSSRREDKKVLQENRLFATLETSTREINLADFPPFLLTDTVGFIDHLPTALVDSFRSTLEEIREADLLIQVVDYSDSESGNQIIVTNETLAALGVKDIPMIYLYNKSDLIKDPSLIANDHALTVSLEKDDDLTPILKMIMQFIYQGLPVQTFFLPFEANVYGFKKVAFVHDIDERKDGYLISAQVRVEDEKKFHKYLTTMN